MVSRTSSRARCGRLAGRCQTDDSRARGSARPEHPNAAAGPSGPAVRAPAARRALFGGAALLLVLAVGLVSARRYAPAYSVERQRAEFVKGCTSEGGAASSCVCMFDRIHARLGGHRIDEISRADVDLPARPTPRAAAFEADGLVNRVLPAARASAAAHYESRSLIPSSFSSSVTVVAARRCGGRSPCRDRAPA